MFSATKNFILTFLIALVIFSLIAYMIVGLVVNNLLGIGNSSSGPNNQNNSEDTGDSSGGDEGFQLYGDGGDSFNMLLIGTDYRPSEFINYDPEVLESLYGIVPEPVTPSPIPNDVKPAVLHVVSDKTFSNKDGLLADDGKNLVFQGGFFSVGYRVIEADTIVLVRVDKERGEYTYTAFPTDAYVAVEGRYVKLSEVYGIYGLETLIDKVHAITGVVIDNYALVSMEAFPALIDALGGIVYNVPCDMNYVDVAGGINISLKAGNQKLDGKAVLDMLSFNSYAPGQGSRESTTLEFVKRFVSTFINITNYSRASKVFIELSEAIETDFTAEDFAGNIDMIFKYASNGHDLAVKTGNVKIGNDSFTIIDEEATLFVFSGYRRIFN